MLRIREIQAIAAEEKVRDTQIEKDYVITWLLWGLAQQENLSDHLVFKGGTALKKAWFSNYRFSEDLDFTLADDGVPDDFLLDCFHQISALVQEHSGIQMNVSRLEKHQSGSIVFYEDFVGPLGGKPGSKSVKVDITRGEKMLFEPVPKRIISIYADRSDEFSLSCYRLEEILVEKLVALMGRTQPRDLYDLWFLLEIQDMEAAFLKAEFQAKAIHKGHNPEHFISTWSRKPNSSKPRGRTIFLIRSAICRNSKAFAGRSIGISKG